MNHAARLQTPCSILTVAVVAAVVVGIITPCIAEPLTADARTVLADVKKAYLTKPVCEKMTIALKPASGPTRREELIVRIDPRKPDDPADDVLALEMGDVRVHAADGRLTAILTTHPTTVYSAKYEGELTTAKLSRLLGSLPLPQLEVMRWEGDAARIDLAWFAPRVSLAQATTDTKTDKPVWTIPGESDRAAVTLTIDGGTSRLLKLAAAMHAEKSTIEITFDPVPLTPTPSWAIDLSGRRAVDGMWRLTESAPPIRVGDSFPADIVRDADGKAVDLRSLCLRPGPLPNAASMAVVVVADENFFSGVATQRQPLAASAAKAIGDAAAAVEGEAPVEPPVSLLVVAITTEPPATQRDKIAELAKGRWDLPGFSVSAPRFVWPARVLLPRLIPESHSAVVVVDAELKVLGVVPLDGRGEDVKGLAADIRAALPKKKTAG